MKALSLIIGAICFAGCTPNPSLTKMSGAGYRANGCYDENKLQCSRMMRQMCPEGVIVMNPGTAEINGPIFICSNAE